MKYLLLLLLPLNLFAQSAFLPVGKVEYEKTINMHKQMSSDDDWAIQFKKNMPQFRKLYFDLVFNETQSYYKPGREAVDDKYATWGDLTEANQSFALFNEGRVIQQKQVYEEKFLVNDSLLHIEWKLLDEPRTIAGFECKKALGRFNDSLYVVAFYCDEILATGGPEGFHGLPGLILGLAFPRIHTTWFATKVEVVDASVAANLKVPAAGKKVNRAELTATVQGLVKRWSRWDDKANEILWQLPW